MFSPQNDNKNLKIIDLKLSSASSLNLDQSDILLYEDLASTSKIKLSVAFSRDQPEKVYVQDLLYRDRHEIWRLLEQEKASLYVCGDAKSMAGDVNKTLLNIVQEFSPETDAKSYITSLEKEHRYQKDVWVV